MSGSGWPSVRTDSTSAWTRRSPSASPPGSWPTSGSGHRRRTGWTPFTYPVNLTQQPACTVPCGVTDAGLPVGAQLASTRHGDEPVPRTSAVLHAALRRPGWWTQRRSAEGRRRSEYGYYRAPGRAR
ncbi:amidase family protein [Streptomyces sp. NPDC051453]|uniref:amidase family protein n=1 Tax=Streptomyces sp. NPDC051453 TaxID=3154941 RepID=UPI00343A094D